MKRCSSLNKLFSYKQSPGKLKMWIASKVDLSAQMESVFNELHAECRHNAPGSRLSINIRTKLERFPRAYRKEIVSRELHGCSPLFVACKRGHVDIVDYLLTTCDADVEQRGLFEVPDDRSVHCVSPLWCAAVSGRLEVIKCLLAHKADVNAISDSGSTPVRSACFMTHLDVVQLLVENGADIHRANYNGGTCLINSVQSVQLCKLLLENGAEVNTRDIQNKTALHYAIQEHRLETTKLLLAYGANPFYRSRYNDDALQTACLKGATLIFDLLVDSYSYPYERIADALELMGSTYLDEHNDTQMALYYWERATDLRNMYSLYPKNRVTPHSQQLASAKAAYNGSTEFETEEDLRSISLDVDEMRIQSLLVCERILGVKHKDLLFRLMYRGAAYADALQYQRCIDLWRYALEVRVEKDSILFNDTCFTAQALVRLYLDLHERRAGNQNQQWGQQPAHFNEQLKFSDVYNTTLVIVRELNCSKRLLAVEPVYKRQQESFDRILKCLTHLIHLLIAISESEADRSATRELVREAVKCDPRSSHGDSLLHLVATRNNTIKSTYFADDSGYVFPSAAVARLLVECGANIVSRNYRHCTPLHFVALPANYNQEFVKLLLDNGAHIDHQNNLGETPAAALMANPVCTLPLMKHTSLKCLAASVVVNHKISYLGIVPTTVAHFVRRHDTY
ncbi:protein fem-1 homolog C [Cloeon dipterum]|uniref:protein fem-1 homolog C n=1 Tax=Cloeon dipterum TaxID=197152 RepID=UPI00322097C3